MHLIIAQFLSTTKNSITTLEVAYNKLNCTNILVSHAKKMEFKLNLLFYLKFSDGDGPNLCRVKKKMLVPHLFKIYFVWVDPRQF